MSALRLFRSFAMALVLSAVLLWPFMFLMAGSSAGQGLFAGRELCFAAGVECGPGQTLGSILVSRL